MQSSSSPFLVNIVPLANVVTNTSGINQVTQLTNAVTNIQQMVNFDKKAIYTNYLGEFTAGNGIQLTSPLCNVATTTSTYPSNIAANSITANTITVGGTCYAQAFVTLSDKDVKRDMSVISTISFDTLASVNTYTYKYMDSTKGEIGVLAQELEAAYPDCITVAPNNKKYVNYSGLVAVLLQAVKDLEARVKALEARSI
jgi:hypothetical protein